MKDPYGTKETMEVLFNQMLACMREGVIAINTDLEVLFINPAAVRLSGRGEELAVGKNVNVVFPFVVSYNLLPLIPAYLPKSNRPNYFYDVILRNTYSDTLLLDGCIARIMDEKEEMFGYLLFFHDTSEIRRLTATVTFHENYDIITRLSNKENFYVQLQILLDNRKHRTSHNAVLYIDIDNFKQFKSLTNIDAGDSVLRQIANIIRTNIKVSDIPARLAGDDFIIILRDCSKKDSAEVAKRILKVCEESNFHYNDNIYKISLSIGVYQISESEDNAKTIVDNAYKICNTASAAGGNRVSIN